MTIVTDFSVGGKRVTHVLILVRAKRVAHLAFCQAGIGRSRKLVGRTSIGTLDGWCTSSRHHFRADERLARNARVTDRQASCSNSRDRAKAQVVVSQRLAGLDFAGNVTARTPWHQTSVPPTRIIRHARIDRVASPERRIRPHDGMLVKGIWRVLKQRFDRAARERRRRLVLDAR